MRGFLMGLVVVGAALMSAAQYVPALTTDGNVEVTRARALPGGKPITIYLDMREGRCVRGFTQHRTYNRMPGEVDGSGLTLGAARLSGTVGVKIKSDTYVPAGGRTLEATYVLDTKLETFAIGGTYTGKCDGADVAGAATGKWNMYPAGKDLYLGLSCEDTMNPTAKAGQRRAMIMLTAGPRGCYGARIIPPGSITDTAYAAKVTAADVTLKDSVLAGTMSVEQQPQNAAAAKIKYGFTFTGMVIAGAGCGTIAVTVDGKPSPRTGTFSTTVERADAPAAGDCLMTLTLHDLLGPGKYLNLYISANGRKVTHGFGATPNYNNATHEVDPSGLKAEGGRLTGKVNVTVLPDPWIPTDRQPQEIALTLDAEVRGWSVVGKYEGTLKGAAVKGELDGGLERKPAARKALSLTLKLENALSGSSEYGNRAFVGVTLDGTKVTGGGASNNHTDLKGTVTGGELRIVGEELLGTVHLTVEKGAEGGEYQFSIKGLLVGDVGAGRFAAMHNGKTKEGRYWVAVKYEG